MPATATAYLLPTPNTPYKLVQHLQSILRISIVALNLLLISQLEATFGDGVGVWQEGAENGYTNVLDGTPASYNLIQSDSAMFGTHAFHLVSPEGASSSFELDVDIDVSAETKLFFSSKLQWATTQQIATVQVSTDGGTTWPNTIFSQAGTSNSGESAFSLKEISLNQFSGQQIRIRFQYKVDGSYYSQTWYYVGWLIDDIQIGASYQKSEWSIGNPSADEVLYVELINRSRANALLEAQRLANLPQSDVLAAYSQNGIDTADIITQYQWHIANGFMADVAQPLAFNSKLLDMSQLHTNDMFNNQFQGHESVNPAPPFAPGYEFADRVNAIDYSGYASENVFAYANSPEHAHAAFEVDWGKNINNPTYFNPETGQNEYNPGYNEAFNDQGMQNPAGHRLNIHNPNVNEVGIGVINGTNGNIGPQLVTQNFGNDPGRTYICGIVFNDLNNDDFYTVQSHSNTEGRAGIRIDVDGSFFYTFSTDAGAYAIPVPGDGTYDVTFSGAGIETYSTSVTITGGKNFKLDHEPVDLTGYALWESQSGLTLGADGDDDGDRVANLVEYALAGMNPLSADADSAPVLTNDPDGKYRFTVNKRAGVSGIAYTVQVSTTLEPSNWQDAGTAPGTAVETDNADQLVVAIEPSIEKIFVRLEITEL